MLGRSKISGKYVELRCPDDFDEFLRSKVFHIPATVTRMRKLYDVDALIETSVNPNLRGLGHSQWALEGIKNPVHCIRMVWDGPQALAPREKVRNFVSQFLMYKFYYCNKSY
jgi:hypothetical protein